MAFKLSTLAAKDSFVLQLRHPVTDELLYADDNDSVPITIEIYGQSSKQHRNALVAMQNRIIARKNKTMSGESLREESIDILVAVSKEASPADWFAQIEVTSDPEGFHKLYSNDEYMWLKNQVQDALNDLSNFIKA